MQLYKDPTMEAAQNLEYEAKQCAVCATRRELGDGRLSCGKGKVWPFCRGGNGFMPDHQVRAANENPGF